MLEQGWVEDVLTYEFPDIGAVTKSSWAVELDADVKATHIMFDALFDQMTGIDDHTLRGVTTGAMLCGGLAAALEGIYRLEVNIVGKRVKMGSYTPEHPPAHLRWKSNVHRIGQMSRTQDFGEIVGFANLLGRISKQFLSEHQV